MKILIVSPFVPFPADTGGKIRVYNLLKNFSKSNEVSLICLQNEAEVDEESFRELRMYCEDVLTVSTSTLNRTTSYFSLSTNNPLFNVLPAYISRFYSEEFKSKLDELLCQNHYDIIFIEFLYMAQYFSDENGDNLVLDEHNIESDLVTSMFPLIQPKVMGLFKNIISPIEERKTRMFEKKICEQVSKVFVMSDIDSRRLSRIAPKANIYTIPNGVDISIHPILPLNNSKNILFVGGMYYPPNVEGINYFIKEVFPIVAEKIPDVKLFIVGNNPKDRFKVKGPDNIYITGRVASVRKYYDNATLTIVPLLDGSGSRLKILESMAFGRVVVSTSKGCEGLNVTNNKNIIIEDDKNKFAQRVVMLINDHTIRQMIANEARKLVEEQYSWEIISKKAIENLKEKRG